MSDYTFPNLTTAVVGVATTTPLAGSSSISAVVEVSNGTVGLSTTGLFLNIVSNTVPGYLTGRRPSSGQLFPRGVYNK